MAWFSFTGTDPVDPTHYELQGSAPACLGNQLICAVQSDNDGSDNPELTPELKDEMIQTLNDRSSSTNVRLRNP